MTMDAEWNSKELQLLHVLGELHQLLAEWVQASARTSVANAGNAHAS